MSGCLCSIVYEQQPLKTHAALFAIHCWYYYCYYIDTDTFRPKWFNKEDIKDFIVNKTQGQSTYNLVLICIAYNGPMYICILEGNTVFRTYKKYIQITMKNVDDKMLVI